jgi:hypothetical protein
MMTLVEQTKAIKAAVADWAKNKGGTCEIVSDFVHLVESILSQKAGAPCVFIAFNSEDPRGENARAGRVDRGFLVVVSMGRSLQISKGDILIKGSSGSEPLFALVAQVRELCLGIEFDADRDECAQYKGTRPFQVEGFLMDAYQIEFSVGGQNVQRR